MNPRSEWFKRNTESESIRRIPTSDSLRLKDWSGFIRIQSPGVTRIETDWFWTELHQTRLKTFFGLTRMSSDWRGNRFRNKSDWFGMYFNPKLSPGLLFVITFAYVYTRPKFLGLYRLYTSYLHYISVPLYHYCHCNLTALVNFRGFFPGSSK